MRIRCPNCQHSIAVLSDTDETISDIFCPSCNTKVVLVDNPESADSALPTTIAQFELTEKLGEGAFGSVWLARDTELHRDVAIKIPRKRHLSAKEAEQFLREARSAAQLTHQNIIGIHEVGRTESLLYIVSDFVDGETLADLIAKGRMDTREAAILCAKIADALHHAHERGVIHRDLKPGNIMVDKRGEPHIMDFGIAKQQLVDTSMTVEGQILGTPAYMPPEQADGEAHRVDRRADVYSLGVILYELLTGERPFQGNIRTVLYQVIHEDPPPLRKFSRKIPKDLEIICLKCLEKNRRQRYDTAADLADDLRRWLEKLPIKARPLGPISRMVRWSQRNPALATAVGLVIAVTAAGFVGVTTAWLAEADARATAQAQRQDAENARQQAIESAKAASAARELAEANAAEAREQKRLADEQRARVEKIAELLQQAKEDAEAEAAEADRQRLKAKAESIRANEALADLEKARAQEQKTQEALKNAASQAYLDLSKHLEAKGEYELVIANYQAASELGIVSEDHSKLFEESLQKKFSMLDAQSSPENLPPDQRELAAKFYFSYAQAARDKQDFAEAFDRLERAQRFDPKAKENARTYQQALRDTHVAWARQHEAKKDYDQALEQYSLAKRTGGDPRPINTMIAELFAKQAAEKTQAHAYEEAIRLYQQAIEVDPEQARRLQRLISNVYVEHAEKLLADKEPSEAAELFVKAAAADPEQGDTLRSRAGAALKLAGQSTTDRNRALAFFKRAAETDLENKSDYLRAASNLLQTSARTSMQQGDHAQAAQDFLAAAKTDPDNAETLHALAASAFASQAKKMLADNAPIDSVIEILEKAVSVSASESDAVSTLVQSYTKRALQAYKNREYKLASEDYSRIIKLQPRNVNAYLGRANMNFSQRDYESALEDYAKVLELDPSNSMALQYRVEINTVHKPSKSKDVLQRSINDLEKLIAAQDNLKYRQRLAYLLALCPVKELRDGERAVLHAQRVCEEGGWDKSDNLTLLASAYAQAGNSTEAVKWMQQAIDKAPQASEKETLKDLLDRYRRGEPPP